MGVRSLTSWPWLFPSWPWHLLLPCLLLSKTAAFASSTANLTCPVEDQCLSWTGEVCMDRCNGVIDCKDARDEHDCEECLSTSPDNRRMIRCIRNGRQICLGKPGLCSGVPDCTDFQDEKPQNCDDCDDPKLFKCHDGKYCVRNSTRCNEFRDCEDGSDEFDCKPCNATGEIACPGEARLCVSKDRQCDGIWFCPDGWDELLQGKSSTGEGEVTGPCSECRGVGHGQWLEGPVDMCRDKTRCVWEPYQCDGNSNCEDSSDEDADICLKRNKCKIAKLDEPADMFHCKDGKGCIKNSQRCTGHGLCTDKSDSAGCRGACYSEFPALPDIFRKMCQDGERCYPAINHCDNMELCTDGSDELNCPWITKINTTFTILISLALLIPMAITYVALLAFVQKILRVLPKDLMAATVRIPEALSQQSISELLDNHDGQGNLNTIFFNSDPLFLLQLVELVSIQPIHPAAQHQMVMALKKELPVGEAVFYQYIHKTIGYNNHSKFLVSMMKKPGLTDIIPFQVKIMVSKLPGPCGDVLNNLFHYKGVFFYTLDLVKEMVFIMVIKNRMDQVVDAAGNWTNSTAEQLLWHLAIASIVVTHILACIQCFHKRDKVFNMDIIEEREKRKLNILLILTLPILPLLFMIRLAELQVKLHKNIDRFKKKKISCKEYFVTKLILETRSSPINHCLTRVRVLEGTFEHVPSLMVLVTFMSFWKVYFFGSKGKYHYFYSVAQATLTGENPAQAVFYFFTLALTLLTPVSNFVRHTDTCLKGALRLSHKCCLALLQLLVLVARVVAFSAAISLPALARWDFMSGMDHLTDTTQAVTGYFFRADFESVLNVSLESISDDMITIFSIAVMPIGFLHMFLVGLQTSIMVPDFWSSSVLDKATHISSTLAIVVPYWTQGAKREKTRKIAMQQDIFQLVLHLLGNLAILYISKIIFFYNDLSQLFSSCTLMFDLYLILPVFLLNLCAGGVYTFYQTRLELWSFLPDPPVPMLTELAAPLPQFHPQDLRIIEASEDRESGVNTEAF